MNERDILKSWAEKAAEPFSGKDREEVISGLRLAVGHSIRAAATTFADFEKMSFAYYWDGDNNIFVEMDEDKFTEDMLIIRGKDWV